MSSPPTKYARQFDFTDFSTDNPDEQQPGVSLDAEFDTLKSTTDATIDRLNQVQRSDGALANQIVTPDSLAPTTVSLFGASGAPRGPWLTLTAYAQKDLVSQGGNTYICLTAHTSGIFATDLAGGKWLLYAAAVNSDQFAIGAGTADAITAAFGQPITTLPDGLTLKVRAFLPNATTTPTFTPDAQAAHTITKLGGKALVPGDIAGVGHELNLRFNALASLWELLNPASVTQWAVGGGTANAVTGTFPETITTLYDGLTVSVRAPAANTSNAPTFQADATAAHAITKFGGLGLSVGEYQLRQELILRYNLANTRWELLNPMYPIGWTPINLAGVNIANNGAAVQIDTTGAFFTGLYLISYDFTGAFFRDFVMHFQFTSPQVIASNSGGSPGTRTYNGTSQQYLTLAIAGSPANILAAGLTILKVGV